ncbi:MAG: MBL fold metallo-hydrolase [Methanomassiliicoccales archaeon]|nr:MBL fold metallo-hydrolase [Methanomassiliicoccales archaeon]
MLSSRRSRIFFVIVIAALLIASTTFGYWLGQNDEREEDAELTVRFLNIGHGLSILITTPDDKNILIDAGSFDNFTSTVDFLQQLEVPRIDAFIITHPHPDHVSFAVDVLQQYDVLAIYMPGNADDLDPEGWSAVMNATAAEGCPVYNDTTIDPGDYLDLSDDVTFQVMWIDANATLINDSCIVLRMDYKGTSFLFTADIETAAESAMMDLGLDLDIDILQVAHHGVDSGTSEEFLNASTPEVAIISCGQGYGIPEVPQPGVVARLSGIPIYTTMFNSMVVVEVGEDYSIFYE